MENKPALLLLVHRIPYPPNKGDKIRSYHLLQHLRKRYRVFLGTFIDDPADNAHRSFVESLCDGCCFVELNPLLRKVASLRGLLTRQALTLPYYASAVMQQWVDRMIEQHDIERVIAFSSATAQFVDGKQYRQLRRIMDFIDIDSDKWAQYAQRKGFPMRQVYQREARRLLAYEQRIAASFDASSFVSQQETRLFQELAPRSAARIHTVYNGVDLAHFSPKLHRPNPYSNWPNERHLVFVGAMDYWPNEDAVRWFVEEVMPRLRRSHPVRFWIVGSNPPRSVEQLGLADDVEVTGRVEDVRDYVANAEVAVAPLRIARGIQNKVLESMALAIPTVVSPAALEGIPAQAGQDLLLGETAEALAVQVQRVLDNPTLAERLSGAARDFVESHFDWEQNLSVFDELLESVESGK